MRSRTFLLVGGLALLIGPATALTQFPQQPGGGGFGGGGGFRGMMNMDPSERWNQMTGGKDVWKRTDITDPQQQRRFDFFARSLNITNGQITRQQYVDWSQQMRQRFQNGGGGPGNRGGGQGGPQAGGAGGGGGFNPNAMVEMLFRRYDKNGDGVLNYDEMPDNLKAERDKYDRNKDGMIDLNEFKEYMKGRMDQIRAEIQAATGSAGRPSVGPGGMPMLPTAPEKPPEEEIKRVVYRAGKLPKELPAWFAQYDKDGDGQIGLYEWKAAGQPLDRFLAMDRNGDGFLTVEEVLKYEAAQNKGRGGQGRVAANSASPGGAAGGFQGRGNFGSFNGPPSGGNGQPRQRGQGRDRGNRGPR